MAIKVQQVLWFGCGVLVGMTALSVSFAALTPTPTAAPSQVTDDTVMYQRLSEIRVHKEANPSFDKDIENLSRNESRYHEKLPLLDRPMQRIAKTKYRYTGASRPVSQAKPRLQNSND